MPELQNMNYNDRLIKLKLYFLDYRRKTGDMIQLFKILKGLEDITVENIFQYLSLIQEDITLNCFNQGVTKVLDSIILQLK